MAYQFSVTDEELALFYSKPRVLASYYENTHFTTSDNKTFRLKEGKLVPVHPRRVLGVSTAGNNEQSFALTDISDPDVELIAITGHAGTGKTFIALVGAIAERRDIVFTREVVEAGREIGFLPGDSGEKFMPYMRPFFDNITEIERLANKDKLGNRVSLQPLQFMRGGTIRDSILIVDEAQNCTVEVLKMAISRAGKGTKVILCGSFNQIDPVELRKQNDGLTQVINAFKGQKCFSHIHLIKDERSNLARLADKLL